MTKNSHPILKPWSAKPLNQAVISKLVAKNNNTGNGGNVTLGQNQLTQRISSLTSTDISDATALQDLLPEQQLMMQILTSSILSPKDLTTIELGYGVEDGIFPSQLATPLSEVMSNFFNGDYKIEGQLSPMLEEMLFTKGSVPWLVLPETSIDAVINGTANVSVESITGTGEVDVKANSATSLGILGNGFVGKTKTAATPTYSLESLLLMGATQYKAGDYQPNVGVEELCLSVIDNPSALKLPKVVDRLARQMAMKRVSANFVRAEYSLEAVADDGVPRRKSKKVKGMSETEVRALYKPRTTQYMPVVTIQRPDDLQRPTVGHPLALKVPPEAVIPVHRPGDPTDHIGYFILTDRTGNFISTSKSANNYRDLEKNLAMNKDQIASMLTTSMQDVNGRRYTQSEMDRQEMSNIYTEIVEADLLHRFATGVYGDNVAIARAEETFHIMFTRMLAKQHTQMIYVPAELMTYMAFDYNDYGIGRSLTDKNKILGSIRAMLLFANTMSGIKNAVGRTDVNVTLDEADPNPSETVEILMDNYMRNRGSGAPFGTMNTVEIVDYLNVASVQLNVEGNTRYPQTKFAVEDKNSQKSMTDTTLEDDMRKRYIMGFGISPETVDASAGVEFATTVIQNNLLFAKQCMGYQTEFCVGLSDFMVKFAKNSQIILEQLREVVRNNKKLIKGDLKTSLTEEGYREENDQVDAVVGLFLDIFKVTLPAPDTGSIESQLTAMDTYSKSLDVGLDQYVNEEFLDASMYGDSADTLLKMKAAIKASFMRKYMQKNNILPELTELITRNEDKKPAFDLMLDHKNLMESLMDSVGPFLEQAKKERKDFEDEQAKIDESLGVTAEPTGGDEFGATGDDLDATDGDLGDGTTDDLGAGDTDGLSDDLDDGSDNAGETEGDPDAIDTEDLSQDLDAGDKDKAESDDTDAEAEPDLSNKKLKDSDVDDYLK
jgi:hypothetical protein